MGFQRLQWRVERIAWVVIGLVLLAAFAGLIGAGPLSQSRTSNDSLSVSYDRFLHKHAAARYRIEVSDSQSLFRLSFNSGFLKKVSLERIVPRPSRAEVADGIVLSFEAVADVAGVVDVFFKPTSAGLLQTEIGLPGVRPIRFTQLVYP